MKLSVYKKFVAVAVLLLLCFLLSACLGGGVGSEIAEAQKSTAALKRGKMQISSSINSEGKNEVIKTEFVFSLDENGEMTYCHTQLDKSGKIVFCEYTDSSSTKQWFIGKGWSEIERISYNSENPHRFLKLITSPIEKDWITDIVCEDITDLQKSYMVTINPEKANKEGIDYTIDTQTIIYTVTDGIITSYNDIAELEANGSKSSYQLILSLEVPEEELEIACPELRDYSGGINN